MIGWVVVWVLGVAAVLALWANRRYHWAAGWRYSWTRAAHTVTEAPEPEYRFVDMYGSMVLAEERDWLAAPTPLQAQYEAVLRRSGPDWQSGEHTSVSYLIGSSGPKFIRPDWREQTAADLSPEALADDEAWAGQAPPASYAEWLAEGAEDSGPGDLSSLALGPDLAVQLPCGHVVTVPPGEQVPDDGCGPPPYVPPVWTWGQERLADTADVMDARLLADVAAELRAQDDDTALYLSRLRSACAQARLDLQAALA